MLKFEFPTDIERKLFKQLDFALVLTYTKAAQAAQKAVQKSLPHLFVLRNTFVMNSIRMEKATKQNPVATVFVPTEGKYNADFLLLQETGGLKNPSKNYLAIPTDKVKRNKRDIVTKTTRQKLLTKDKEANKKNKIFVIDASTPAKKAHGLPHGVYQRGHKGKGNKGKRKLILLFAFEKSASITARFNFQKTAIKAAIEALPKAFEDALIQALKTAR
jgi:hypothetical protein